MTQQTMEVQKELAGIQEFLTGRVNPLEEEIQRMRITVSNLLETSREVRRGELMHANNNRPRVISGRYAGMDHLDLALISSIVRAQIKQPIGIAPGMLEEWGKHLTAAMDSTTTGEGDELVDTQEARDLWDDVNLETSVAGLFHTLTMPTNPFQIPLQMGDINWYPGTENVATKSTTPATKRQTLTAYELVGEVPWSYDLDEDAVISMMEELRRGIMRNAREVIDDVILNADTTETNNINADGATISDTDAGKAQWLLGFDGLIHQALLDNSAMSNNHAAAVDEDMFNELRRLTKKYAVNPSENAFITDISTYLKTLTISNFQTLDKLGPQATLLTGQLGAVEGIPLIVSEQMLLTASDGKVTDGVAGTVGRLLLVNRGQWRIGFKRELQIETIRDAQKRQNIMVVSFRIAFQERSATASSATHTALQYNITGV
ncbi:MAG: phage major capsid protein [Dehalococcoidia bacterium]